MTTAMPEWLARNDRPQGPWLVQEGAARRGEAWTNLYERRMRVPYGDDTVARVIRAHEMMHARVSPENWSVSDDLHISEMSARAAEEFRVNTLVGVAGFDIESLCDGSEANAGRRDGEVGDWNNMVVNVAAMAGSKACKDYLRGLKATNADMAASAREIEKAVIKTWTDLAMPFVTTRGRGRKALTQAAKERAAKIIGSTTPDPETGLPQGFMTYTVPLARMLDSLLKHESGVTNGNGEDDGDEQEMTLEDVKEVVGEGQRGKFARLILDHDVVLSKRVNGNLGRRRVAANIGRNPRRIHRMLVDPDRRVFDRKVRGKGGIVLIDQSGSMRLSEDDISAMIEAAPGCTIIGYSHRPGSTTIPNAWVLAERGKVTEEVRSGNGGNGVDGPAIRFAATKRRSGEPFIWVCDGMVTDGINDQYHQNLGEQCARLVVRHGIQQVASVAQAIEALETAVNGRNKTAAVGYVADTKAWRERNAEVV